MTDVEMLLEELETSDMGFTKLLWAYLENGLITKDQFQDLMLEALSHSYMKGLEAGNIQAEEI